MCTWILRENCIVVCQHSSNPGKVKLRGSGCKAQRLRASRAQGVGGRRAPNTKRRQGYTRAECRDIGVDRVAVLTPDLGVGFKVEVDLPFGSNCPKTLNKKGPKNHQITALRALGLECQEWNALGS